MHCPHCGSQNDEGNRFCVNCGSELSPGGDTGIPSSRKERFARLVGTDRRTRLVTVATVAAIAIALIAFLSLGSSEDTNGESAYLQGIDRTCVAEKERIANLGRETLSRRPANLQAFASALVTIVAEWQASLRKNPAPPAEAAEARELDKALLETLVDAGKLALLIRAEGSPAAIGAQAQAVDEATTRVDAAIEGAGLDECAALPVSPLS